jgi:cellulose synthase/poly-beta-1,6-N-acetylglucosamine synthase-like glycosyltransferase
MNVLAVFFWVCLFLAVYPYLIYPFLLVAWSRIGRRRWHQRDAFPTVSMIISVHNEEGVIREKIENALALDYPEDRLEIVVVSDGSTDDTEKIVSSYPDRCVVLKAYERAGKTACLNRAVAEVESAIVVFTDANSMFPQQALKKIARNFADERIGLVTGWTKYRRPGSEEEEAPGLYARLEKVTKEGESLVSSCVGADGAIFAIRRELYRRLEDYDINDFVIPLNVIGQNRRVILDPEVYCLEEPSEGAMKEFRRQARITNRTLGAIRRNARFLNPLRYGTFTIFLLSHKVLRFMVPFFAAGLLLASLGLMLSSAFYVLVFAGLCLFILAGVAGGLGLSESKSVSLCTAFLLTNLAQLVGWLRFVTGRADTLWTPQR